MKRNVLLSSAVLPALLATGAMAQISSTNVVNFHDDNNGQAINSYGELFAGQGAYPDWSGNNIWNGFSQGHGPVGAWAYNNYGSYFKNYINPDGCRFFSGNVGTAGDWAIQTGNPGNPYAAYNPSYSTYNGWVSCYGSSLITSTGITSTSKATAGNIGNANSGAKISPVKVAVYGDADDEGLNQLYSTSYCANGTPLFLLGEAAHNDDRAFGNPASLVYFTLSGLPTANVTYGLFLYGVNFYGYSGDNFVVSNSANTTFNALYGVSSTLNGPFGEHATSFEWGNNFVVFTNITPTTDGIIHIYATPNMAQLGLDDASDVGTPVVTTSPATYTTNITLDPNSANWSTTGLYITNIVTNPSVTTTNYIYQTDVNGFQLVYNPPPTALLPTRAQNVYAGGTASFSFIPCFMDTPGVQWQFISGGVTNLLTDTTLGDGAVITGSATTNLTIANVTAAEVGLYQCLLTNVPTGATNVSPLAPLTLLTSTSPNIFSFAGYVMSEFNDNKNEPYNVVPPPLDMGPYGIADGDLSQYETFGHGSNTPAAGFVGPVGVVAKAGAGTGYTVVTAARFYVSGSHPESDPANYSLDGSTDGVTWTHIAGAPLALPVQRNWAGGYTDPSSDVLQEVDFANTTPYLSYRLTFSNIVNSPTISSNGLQIAEVELLGTQDNTTKPVQVVSSTGAKTVAPGGTAVYTVDGFAGYGAGNAVSYQWDWLLNGVTTALSDVTNPDGSIITGSQSPTLTIANVTAAELGYYFCVITGPSGSVSSPSESLAITSSVGPASVGGSTHPLPIPLTFAPIALNPFPAAPYGAEFVIPADFGYKLDWQSVSVTLTGGPNLLSNYNAGPYYTISNGYAFFEAGIVQTNGAYGLPHGGTLLTNWTTSNATWYASGPHYYQLPYWTNWNSNCVFLGNYNINDTNKTTGLGYGTGSTYGPTGTPYVAQTYTSGDLLLTNSSGWNATAYDALSFLVSAAGLPGSASNGTYINSTNTIQIQYADGSSQTVTGVGFPVWGFTNAIPNTNTTVSPRATFAYTASTMLKLQSDITTTPTWFSAASKKTASAISTNNARLWSVDIGLNNHTAAPTNIIFTWTGGTNGVVFAVSGSQNAADASVGNTAPLKGPFTPIAVSGYNAGCVVASDPAANLLAPMTALPNSGTNLTTGGSTYAEVGYDMMATTEGFPLHNSILTSHANPNATYQMPADYHVPMSVEINTTNTQPPPAGNGPISITPSSPVSCAELSFLTTASYAYGGACITNYAIVQHLDGYNESNWFYCYDWVDTAIDYARNAVELPTLNGENGDRYLYLNNGVAGLLHDSVIALSDTSPVTNIQVGYVTGTHAVNQQRSYIIALSGSVNPYPVQLGSYTGDQSVGVGSNAYYSVTLDVDATYNGAVFPNGLGEYASYQWSWVSNGTPYTLTDGALAGTGSTVTGSQTANLEIVNVTTNDMGYFTCDITNPYPSSVQSPLAALTVVNSSEAPVFDVNLESSYSAVVGDPLTLSATVSGTVPMTYQWTFNGSPIGGATTSSYTIPAFYEPNVGSYQLLVTNAISSAASTVAVVAIQPDVAVTVPTPIGNEWNVNGGGAGWIDADTIELTSGGGYEANSVFFDTQEYVGGFQATFTYTDVYGTALDAEGFCFVVQNDPRGIYAQGSDSNMLAYGAPAGSTSTIYEYGQALTVTNLSLAIAKSVAVEFNLFKTNGICFGTNGLFQAGTTNVNATKLSNSPAWFFASGDPINVTITYNAGQIIVSNYDTMSNLTFVTSNNITVPTQVGSNLAYVGFTATTDEDNWSVQQISNFQFISMTNVTLSAQAVGGNVIVSWPVEAGVPWLLQGSTDLINWTNVDSAVTQVAGQNEVTVPITTWQYFRLWQ